LQRETQNDTRTPEAAAARRVSGFTCLMHGEFTNARALLEETLRIYDRDWDRDAKLRYGWDSAATAAGYLALTTWLLGEVDRARALIESAVTQAVESTHVPTQTAAYYLKALIEILRGDAEAALRESGVLVQLSQEHQMGLITAWGSLHTSWARARLGDRKAGATELRQALAEYASQQSKVYVPLYQGLLAELEAEGEGAEGALTRIDEALALAEETGEHWTDALLHRIRGEILLKRDPVNTARAEDAFLTAIAIARQQKARSFELRAALSLAKLYQSSGRAADAHAVLAPALAGFAPTHEFPEIEEAQGLIGRLKATGN